MHLRRWTSMLALVAAVAACSKDATRPEDVDPQTVATGIADLSSSFSGNLAFQSLRHLSGNFGFAAAAKVAAIAALLPPSTATPPAASLSSAQRAALLALALRAPASPQALFPVDVLGKTLVWDTTLGRYVVDPTATGAPSNGVRFTLYLVTDTLLGVPQRPLVVVGNVDLTDESDARANRLGVVVRYLSQTIADYTITATASTVSVSLQAVGYLTDGIDRLDFDLAIQATLTGLNVTYTLKGSNGFEAVMRITLNLDTGATSMVWQVSNGGNTLEVNLSQADSALQGSIRFNGSTVATVSGTPDAPVFTRNGRVELTDADLLALRAIFDAFVDLMGQVSGVFGPAGLVFTY